MNLNIETWKEFKISKLFNVETCSGFDAGDLSLEKKPSGDFIFEFIGRTESNYGVQGYIKELNFASNKSRSITISQVGTIVAQYRKSDYYTSQNMFKLTPIDFKISERQSLFVVAVLNKLLNKYSGYSNYPTLTSLNDDYLLLPAKLYNDSLKYHPDWEFMEEYIKYIENKHIERVDKLHREEIDKALKVAGLTEKDLDGDLTVEPAGMYCEFKVGDLFDGISGDFDIKQEHINDKGVYVVTSGTKNYGILGQTDIETKTIREGALTVDMFGNVFYRSFEYKMVTHARVFSLISKFKMTQNVGLFIETALSFLKEKYSYSNMCSYKKLKIKNLSYQP